jgi:splicing factor 3B subunit 4
MASLKHWYVPVLLWPILTAPREQDKEATVYIGNLDERVTDPLVWELMLQAGRIVNVHLPKDRVTQSHQGYGFVEFQTEEDAEYAAKIMNQVRLYGKPIRVNKASADKQKSVEVGAELFVGNLDNMVDEKMLYDTFSRFGTLVQAPKVARDESNLSKGYGFVSFADFESSDEAIANMNGQYLMNQEISVQYAYKKDGKGERHGDDAERMLASQARKHNVQVPVQPLPPQLFATASANPAMNGDHHGLSQAVNLPPGLAPPPGFGAPPGFPPHHAGGFPHHGGPPPGPPQQHRPAPPPGGHVLPPPPSGLPARPPPSVAGYGGPAGFNPGFAPPPGGPPAGGMGPPPGMPPGFAPPGFAPPGQQPMMPPGFQPPYGPPR